MKITNLDRIANTQVSHNPAITKKVMLDARDLPHLTNFSQAVFAPGQVAQKHFHSDMCEVFFVETGKGTIRIGDRDYPLIKGTCVAVEAGESHEIVNNGDRDLVLTYFGLKI
jgi:quercetin dioxygenase-like cupin family protein